MYSQNTLRRLMVILALLAAGLIAPSAARAHDGDGVDVGYAHVTAEQAGGVATIEMRISHTEACDRFAPTGITGQRAEIIASGPLHPAGACAFSGTIELPAPGRWTVLVQVTYDGWPTALELPIGVTDEPGSFERADWLHSTPPPERWFRSPGIIVYALLGLLVGSAFELARRNRMRFRATRQS